MAEETKIIRIVVDSSKAVDGSAAATRALEKLERAQVSTASAFDRMEQALGRVGGYLKAQLGLMVAEVASRLLSMAKGALDAAANMDELAEQVGLTARGLQAMQFAAVQSNVKLEQLEGGLGKFSQKMGEAADGSKEMIEALDRLGVKNLDAAGKLRSTESLMTEVAAAILKIEDPARRSAAMVDFFGKTGAKMLPMLKEMAGGFDDMAAKAKAAGTMISAEAIAKLDKLGDASERSQLKMRALFAENAAGPLTDVLDFITKKMENLATVVRGVSLDFSSLLKIAAGIASPGQIIGQLLAKSPSEKIASDLASARGEATAAWENLNVAQTDRDKMRMMSAYSKAQQRVTALEQQQGVLAVSGKADYRASDPDGVGIVVASKGGSKLSAVKGAGATEANRISKLMRDNARELDAANAYADASERGARAVSDLEIHFKALKAAQDAFGDTADQNTKQVAALTSKLEAQMKATERLASLKGFNLGTEELERANELLAAENGLINASVEVRSREIALIKLKQEVQAKGLDENDPKEKAAIDRRGEAIAQNERLKAQGDEMRKANELWTEPLKTALSSIQTTAADAFMTIFETGKFSFQALGDVVKRTVMRMIAEFAALAIIRPIMGSMMGGLTGMGLVSPATASSLGYGGGAGGSGFSMPGIGGGAGMFGFLGNPIMPGNIDTEIANWSTYGTSAQNSLGGAPGLGGLTWGQGLAGAATIGMGAYQLATSRNTAGAIGGGLSMLGGGVGLASAAGLLPMLGAAGGPIGMGLGLAGMLIPMLFGGDGGYKQPPLAGANTRFDPSGSGYMQSGTQQLGGKSINGQFSNIGSTLDALFGAVGGLTDPSLAFGASVWNNQRAGTTSTYLISPTQGSNQQTYDESGDPAAAIDRLIAKVFYNSVQNNAAMNASPTLRTALGNKETTSVAQVQALLSLVDAYDKLGKEVPSAEQALDQINAQFASLTAGANEYGLSLAPIQAEQKKLTGRFAQDFIDGMLDPAAVEFRKLDDQRRDSLASAEYIRDNVKDVYVDMARITEYWNTKRLDLEAQYQEQSVGQLQALVRRLTYGDLANASPDTSLAGTRGTYEAMLAQARAGSGSARAGLAGAAEAYATSGRSYFASSAEYETLISTIRRDALEIIGGGMTGTTGGASNSNVNAGQMAELIAAFRASSEDTAALRSEVAALTAQLQRRA